MRAGLAERRGGGGRVGGSVQGMGTPHLVYNIMSVFHVFSKFKPLIFQSTKKKEVKTTNVFYSG
jgi:hypothetical protein